MFKRTSLAVVTVAAVLALGSVEPASADAHGNASCLGFEASGIAPAGSSDEFPGGVKELQTFLHDTFGHQSGAIISEAAHQHLGSHEACDAGE